MKAKFTAGPWTVATAIDGTGHPFVCAIGNHHECVIDGVEYAIARVGGETKVEAISNARMIAACPDLLAALVALLDVYLNDQGYLPEVEKQARAAIAKARGEA